MGIFTNDLVGVDGDVLLDSIAVTIGVGNVENIADTSHLHNDVFGSDFGQATFEIFKHNFSFFLIFPQFPQAGVVFLDAAEHFFHVGLTKVNQDWPPVRAVIGIFTLG